MSGSCSKCRRRRITPRLKAAESLAADFVECLNRTAWDAVNWRGCEGGGLSHAVMRVLRCLIQTAKLRRAVCRFSA
jgi:hypothetical protein